MLHYNIFWPGLSISYKIACLPNDICLPSEDSSMQSDQSLQGG